MPSLQDQLVNAGLVDSKKAKKIKKTKHKQAKANQKSKTVAENETRIQAAEARKEQVKQSKASNLVKVEKEQAKAIQAQVTQIVQMNRQSKFSGDVGFNFVDGKQIKKLQVTETIQKALSKGQLAIIKVKDLATPYHIVPKGAAMKIAERLPELILFFEQGDNSVSDVEEDDPYADFQIPDDLMW